MVVGGGPGVQNMSLKLGMFQRCRFKVHLPGCGNLCWVALGYMTHLGCVTQIMS